MKAIEICFAKPQLDGIKAAMLTARSGREEVAGFAFCSSHPISRNQSRYLCKQWIVPGKDCYESQSLGGITLKQEFNRYLVETVLTPGQTMLHLHSHPGNHTHYFSSTDDFHEARYAKFLGQYEDSSRLMSGVFDESLEHASFRLWNPDGTLSSIPVSLGKIWGREQVHEQDRAGSNPLFARQKVFGSGFQQTLGQMTVALVGCGGIGAPFAEQLSRLGVRRWILVDPDHLEMSNLNRMPFATRQMVKEQFSKVQYVKSLIKRVPYKSEVHALETGIEDDSAQKMVASADLIVTATDNHYSRIVAQKLALTYLRPLLSLGTHIDMQPEAGPRLYCRASMPPVQGGWCLLCANIVDSRQAGFETAPLEMRPTLHQRGYLADVPAPAVYWLNSSCASMGVQIIHGILSGFVEPLPGIDWIFDYHNQQWHKMHVTPQHCYLCDNTGDVFAVGGS
ncbi:MAG: ThiF family adenylyltransferase [SAR324 cluster bacterium]|nr:ThiF family adenylyltransferase [SAR324 cluster bacterium]